MAVGARSLPLPVPYRRVSQCCVVRFRLLRVASRPFAKRVTTVSKCVFVFPTLATAPVISPLILTREVVTPLKARSAIPVVGLAGALLPAVERLLAQTAPQEALPRRVAQSPFFCGPAHRRFLLITID